MQSRNWFTEKINDEIIKKRLTDYISEIDKRLTWYSKHKRHKEVYSNLLLGLAVSSFSLSLILILLKGPQAEISILNFKLNVYASAYFCLLLASTMVLVDRVFGHSSGWIRYMLTELELEKEIINHHNQWLIALTNINEEPLEIEEKTNLLNLIGAFEKSINSIVINETVEWKTNFLIQLESFRKNVSGNLQKAREDLEEYQAKLDEKYISEKKKKELKGQKGHLVLEFTIPDTSSVMIEISGNDINESQELEPNQESLVFPELSSGVYKIKATLICENEIMRVKEELISIQPSEIKTIEFSMI